nr:Hint domain-containing protein [Leisingera methylohalidivorans]
MVTLNSGQEVQLNADGTLTLAGNGDVEDFVFTNQVSNGVNSDTALSTPARSPVLWRVPGSGPPMARCRWKIWRLAIWWKPVTAESGFAPIRIAADRFGRHGELMVSPQHRVLVRGAHAELFFGGEEVLVAAKDLVNGRSVARCPGGEVTYVHLMFDRHQVSYSEGHATETFLPGPQIVNLFNRPVAVEICALFPELDPETGAGCSAGARPALKAYEGRLQAAIQGACTCGLDCGHRRRSIWRSPAVSSPRVRPRRCCLPPCCHVRRLP